MPAGSTSLHRICTCVVCSTMAHSETYHGAMTIAPETLILVALVVFVGYTIFGATGFGASPITIPILAHVLPLTFVLSLAALIDFASGLVLGFHTRRQAHTRELLTLVPFTLVGLTLGVTLLVKLPRTATVLALGVFVCVYALYVILRRGPAPRLSRLWAAPAGVLGGIIGALFGMGGPPYVVYITGRIPDPAVQRATISQMWNTIARTVATAPAGLLMLHRAAIRTAFGTSAREKLNTFRI